MTEHSSLAAEYVLRLLDGEELLEARQLLANDPDFAVDVAWWEERLAPLFDEFEEAAVPSTLWQQIAERIDGKAGGSVITLRKQLFRWRVGAAAAAAAAAVLLVLQLEPERSGEVPARPDVARPAPLLVASLAGEKLGQPLTVAYRPASRELVISTDGLETPANRARELWLIPEGAQPISLGLVEGRQAQRRTLPAPLATRFAAGATLAVSDEPVGGSPTGQPTGDVLAAGSLTTV